MKTGVAVKSKPEVLEVAASVPPLHLPDAESTVQDTLTVALDFCAAKMGLPGPEAALAQMRLGDRNALSYAHYSLGVQVGEALGNLDDTVEAVYLFEYDATIEDECFGDHGSKLPIHLIVLTERKSPALISLAGALDRALTRHYAHAIGPARLASVLDIHLVDSRDVESRMGAGALLTSLYHPPIRVWKR